MSQEHSTVINGKRYSTDESGCVRWEPDPDSDQARLGYVVGTCAICGYHGWVLELDENYGNGAHVGETLCDNCNYCPECGGVMDQATCPGCGYDVFGREGEDEDGEETR